MGSSIRAEVEVRKGLMSLAEAAHEQVTK